MMMKQLRQQRLRLRRLLQRRHWLNQVVDLCVHLWVVARLWVN
jgi:hypothetical protein